MSVRESIPTFPKHGIFNMLVTSLQVFGLVWPKFPYTTTLKKWFIAYLTTFWIIIIVTLISLTVFRCIYLLELTSSIVVLSVALGAPILNSIMNVLTPLDLLINKRRQQIAVYNSFMEF